jgi:5-methylcytosine-specific restriction endonuclease McrA
MDDFSVHAKPVSNITGLGCDTSDPMLMPMPHLEARICELAGHIAAATCQFLLLLADFDAREGWADWEMPSCAAWLSWKCQVAPGTAREYARVARALKGLPALAGELAAGRFSYAKARALTRIATAETEQDLVDMARHMTAAQLDRFACAHRKASGDSTPPPRERKLTWRINDDATISVSATLQPEDGAVFLQALRASRDDLDHPHDKPPAAADGQAAAETVPAEDLADALAEICASYLQGRVATADNPDVYQVIIHAGVAAAAGDGDQPQQEQEGASAEAPPEGRSPDPRGFRGNEDRASAEAREPGDAAGRGPWPIWHPAWLDRCHIEDGPAITPAALQLIGCNATISAMVHDADGTVLAVGRRTRTPPPALRRAVRERDRHRCRFPGCESRRTDLHHIRHWANGGETSQDNLLSLCRRHHTIVHDKGYTITTKGEFHTRDGKHIPRNPPLPHRTGDITASHDATIAYHSIVPPCSGERLNLHYAISVCLANAEIKASRLRPAA